MSTATPLGAQCTGCLEMVALDEPCRCERQILRRDPPARSSESSHACTDSQHYACPGYLRFSDSPWLRCGCRCHQSAGRAARDPNGSTGGVRPARESTR
jgi:hypothetical protein